MSVSMKKIKKINRIKIGLVLSYFLSLFLPVYADTVNGVLYKTSISKVGAGTFFVVFFTVLIMSTIILYFFNEQYHKIAYLVTSGFMVLLLIILAFFKQDGSSLRFAFYLQTLLVGLFFLSFYKESFTVSIFDNILKNIRLAYHSIVRFLRKQIKGYKEKRNVGENQEITTESKDNLDEKDLVTK